jgi:hypothetical protein
MTNPLLVTLKDEKELVVEKYIWDEAMRKRWFYSNKLNREIDTTRSTYWNHQTLQRSLEATPFRSDWDIPAVRLKVYGEFAQIWNPHTQYNELPYLHQSEKSEIASLMKPIFEDNSVFKERCSQIEDAMRSCGLSLTSINYHHSDRQNRWPVVFGRRNYYFSEQSNNTQWEIGLPHGQVMQRY